MATGDRKDPYRGYKFKLEIDGSVQAAFHECSGLHEETAEDHVAKKLPGLHKTGDVTLKRGVIGDISLLKWPVIDGKTQRKNGSIILTDHVGTELSRWVLHNVEPKKWTGPTLNAKDNEVTTDTLEIAHEGLTKA